MGHKKSQPLSSTSWIDLKQALNTVPLLSYLPLNPVLINSYYRLYFVSKDKRFRITIDQNLEYSPFKWSSPPSLKIPSTNSPIIIELKYEQEDDLRAQDIFDFLPFRQTKNSKYMEGINLIYG